MAIEVHMSVRSDHHPGFTAQVVRFEPCRENSPLLPIPNLATFRQVLSAYHVLERLVVYLERDGGESGAVWLHLTGDRAWVCHFTELGGIDSYCRDAGYEGPDLTVAFLLDNGQEDEIHRYWTVTRAEGMQAIEYFLLNAKKDPRLNWVAEPSSLQKRQQ
jgi:hypothetical protein